MAAASAAVLAQLPGDPARLLLRYERSEIAAGEFWRLLSGHFVHLDWSHLLLNIAGLGLVWVLVGRAFRPLQWVTIFTIAVAFIDAGLWWRIPGLDWYVGLSGVLHGVFAAGIVGSWRLRPGESALLGFALVAKLAFEAAGGGLPGTSTFVNGAVITEAHLFGAVGGLATGIALVALRMRPGRRSGAI